MSYLDEPLRSPQASVASAGPAERPSARAPAGEATLGDMLAAIARRKVSIAVITGLAALAAILYGLLATPRYTAATSLLFDLRPRTLLGGDSQIASIATDLALVESQVKLLSSDTVLRRVVERERLTADEEFGAGRPGLRALIMGALGLSSAPAASEADAATEATRALSRAVVVRRSERTYVIDVEVTSRDAGKSARLANAIASAFMADQADARADVARREGGLLRGRLDELQARVRDAERRVAEYKEANRIFTPDGKLLNETQLTDASEALLTARTRTAEARARYDQVQRIIRQGQSPDQLSEALRSGVIERLRQQLGEVTRQEANLRRTLGPRHPSYLEVQEQLQATRGLINDELRRISAAALNELQVAQSQEAQAERETEALKRQSSTTNQSIVRLRDLEREFENSKVVLDRFLRARETIGVEGLDSMNVRVIAPATPPTAPSAPRRLPILALALIAGAGIGVGRALLLEQGGLRGGSAGNAGVPLRLPPLGATPAAGLAGRIRRLLPFGPRPMEPATRMTAAALSPKGPMAQLVRDILARVGAGAEPRTVLVTAETGGLGATTLASNLAWGAAADGRRVLLVDAHPARAGLSAIIADDAPLGVLTLDGRPTVVQCIGPDWQRGPLVVPVLKPGLAADLRRGTGPRVEPLDRLGLAFDLVVLDGPPADDAAATAMAAEADAIVVLTRPVNDPSRGPRREPATLAQHRARIVALVDSPVGAGAGPAHGP